MTIKQKQNLLAYLGYYTGQIDGKWGKQSKAAAIAFQTAFGIAADGIVGPETEKALKHAVAYGMPEMEPEEAPESASWWDGIKHFAREEFKCKCGGKYCNGYPAEMQRTVVEVADRAREHFGAAGYVVSGLRCEEWNRIQGGVSNSRHMSGKAIDLRITGVTAAALLAYINQQPEVRYAYAINGTNVHLDVE